MSEMARNVMCNVICFLKEKYISFDSWSFITVDYAGRAQVIWTSTTQATTFVKDCSQAFITEAAASSLYLFDSIVNVIKIL